MDYGRLPWSEETRAWLSPSCACLDASESDEPTPTSARLFLLGGETHEEAPPYLEAACKWY